MLAHQVLLGYLPKNRQEWVSCLKEKRHLYHEFVRDLIIEDGKLGPAHDDHVRYSSIFNFKTKLT